MSQIQVSKLDPDILHSIFEMAHSFIQSQKFQEAIECLKPVLHAQPDNFHAQYNTAYCLRKLKKYQESLEHFNKSLESDPENSYAKNNIKYIKKIAVERIES